MAGTHGHGDAVSIAQEVLTYLASKLTTVGDIPFELSYNHSGKMLVRGYYMGATLTYGYVEGMDAWGTFWRVKLQEGVYTKLT